MWSLTCTDNCYLVKTQNFSQAYLSEGTKTKHSNGDIRQGPETNCYLFFVALKRKEWTKLSFQERSNYQRNI